MVYNTGKKTKQRRNKMTEKQRQEILKLAKKHIRKEILQELNDNQIIALSINMLKTVTK